MQIHSDTESTKKYSAKQLYAFAHKLGDTDNGLTGPEIECLLKSLKIRDIAPNKPKWVRLFRAFEKHQDRTGDGSAILEFIKHAINLTCRSDNKNRYNVFRKNLNKIFFFDGLVINPRNKIVSTKKANIFRKLPNLPDPEKYDAKVRLCKYLAKLESMGVHKDVLGFCEAELAENNYFHAMLEAVKSINYKLQKLAKCDDDGSQLADYALGAKRYKPPIVAVNSFETKSDKKQQSGFLNLVKITFSMFRNPVAHDARIKSENNKDDLEDLLLLASIIHRRLDKAMITLRPKTD